MARPISSEDVLFRQRLLSCCGFYTAALDGIWGERTDAADQTFFAASAQIAATEGTFDPRSERNLLTLQCNAQRAARRCLAAIVATGLDARIISGTRTYAEQTRLFRQGRFGNPGPRVTNARAGQSWHNFGLAWDIGIFKAGAYLEDGPEYDRAGKAGKGDGVEWGGDWTSFQDRPHFQFGTAGRSVAEARTQFEGGCR